MPVGRVETALSKLPVVARVIERLDAARAENAALHLTHQLFENDRAEYSDRWLRENQAWILANAAPPSCSDRWRLRGSPCSSPRSTVEASTIGGRCSTA